MLSIWVSDDRDDKNKSNDNDHDGDDEEWVYWTIQGDTFDINVEWYVLRDRANVHIVEYEYLMKGATMTKFLEYDLSDEQLHVVAEATTEHDKEWNA